MKPVLTPEEWADYTDGDKLSETGMYFFPPGDLTDHEAAQTMALANHVLRYLKPADVDRLRELHDYTPGSDIQEWMLELADRIEALLPPET